MKEPLSQVILFTIGGFIIILFVLHIRDWIHNEFPKPSENAENVAQIQYPFYHNQASDALKQFVHLSNTEKRTIIRNLVFNLIGMKKWLDSLNAPPYDIICLGELHDESTRRFLVEQFFSTINTDVLLLEATPDKLESLIRRMDTGRSYFPLLGADIMRLLRTVRSKNSNIQFYGIEETQKEQNYRLSESNTRDMSLVHNFWKCYQPGKKNIVLFGRLHCAKEPGWFFHTLQAQAPVPLKKKMLSVAVLGEHQNGPLEAFLYFLQAVGVNLGDFVIPEPSNLHPYILDQFEALNNQIFKKYDALVVFRRLPGEKNE
jgi:hypothetical protein